jgi:hypothetical protein
MDETYRRLGRERNAEFERDALKWQRAAEVRERRRSSRRSPKAVQLVLTLAAAFTGHATRTTVVRPARARR